MQTWTSWPNWTIVVTEVVSAPALRFLVVEDDKLLCAAIVRRIEKEWGGTVEQAATLREGVERLLAIKPTVVVADVWLPDGRCHDLVVEAQRQRPMPSIVAISGRAAPEEAFELARLGVRGYLAKPLSLSALRVAIEGMLDEAQALEPIAMAQVGRTSIHDAQSKVRRAMVEQALALTNWNRTETARILNVTRQAVQHMIREFEISVPSVSQPVEQSKLSPN